MGFSAKNPAGSIQFTKALPSCMQCALRNTIPNRDAFPFADVFLAVQFIFVTTLQNPVAKERTNTMCITNLIIVTARELANKNVVCKPATVYTRIHTLHSMGPSKTCIIIALLQQWQMGTVFFWFVITKTTWCTFKRTEPHGKKTPQQSFKSKSCQGEDRRTFEFPYCMSFLNCETFKSR